MAMTSGTNLPPHTRPPCGDEKTQKEVADHGDQHGEYEPMGLREKENLLERYCRFGRQGGCGWNRVGEKSCLSLIKPAVNSQREKKLN